LLAAACGEGAGAELQHQNPGFRIAVPPGLTVGKDQPSDGGGSLSISNQDHSQEVFLVWSPSGSPTDPVPQFDRHKRHEDLSKIVGEGSLPGGGRYIHIERGNRVFLHSTVASDGFGIECTTSWPVASPPSAAVTDACKTLKPGGSKATAGGGGPLGARPSMPAPLGKLRFGMPLDEVKASAPEALDYDFRPAGWDGVERVNVMFGSSRTLETVFVHLARGTGKALATGAWGTGTSGGVTDLGPKTTWTGSDGITAELTEQPSADVLVISAAPR
jgi:hypothetical protein